MFREILEARPNKKAHKESIEILKKLYNDAGKTYPQGYNMSPGLFEFATNGGFWFGFKSVGVEGKDGDSTIWLEDTDVKKYVDKISTLMKLMRKTGAIESNFHSFLG